MPHPGREDERLVRSVLQDAFPAERSVFSQRRGAQIIRAAALEALERPGRHRPFVAGRVAALAAAAFTLVAGTAGVAGAALPGQPLYPIKRAVERALIAFAGDDLHAARLELRFAERRIDEAAAVAADADAELAPVITGHYREHVTAAVQLGGEAVADEVDRLERERAARRAASDGVATDLDDAGQIEPDPSPVLPEPTPTPTPIPVPSGEPSPSTAPVAEPADDAVTPVPLTTPEPSPSPSPQLEAPPEPQPSATVSPGPALDEPRPGDTLPPAGDGSDAGA